MNKRKETAFKRIEIKQIKQKVESPEQQNINFGSYFLFAKYIL